jgi:uncharacterized protein (TIGR04255 family)
VLNAPDPPAFRMRRAPLVQAVAQVIFPLQAQLSSIEKVAPLQETLRDLFPYMQQKLVQELTVTVGGANVSAPSPISSAALQFEFSNDDGWIFTVAAGGASLTVGGEPYAGVADFEEKFFKVLDSLQRTIGVTRCDRIGVRYLSLVGLSAVGTEWANWFKPELIGVAHPELVMGRRLEASVTETRIQVPPRGLFEEIGAPISGVIRNGIIPPNSLIAGAPPKQITEASFVLDIDAFCAGLQPFDAQRLADEYRSLHAEIERVFYWTLTEDGKKQFELELLKPVDEER